MGRFTAKLIGTLLFGAIVGFAMSTLADNASDLDMHTNVRSALAIADASSGDCAEVSAGGALSVSSTDLANLETQLSAALLDLANLETQMSSALLDLTILETQTSAANVDLANIETQLSSALIDIANLETQLTAANVDLAALEVNTDTLVAGLYALTVDLAAIEVNTDTMISSFGVLTGNTATMISSFGVLTGNTATMVAGFGALTDDTAIMAGWDNSGGDACKVEPDAKTGKVVNSDGQVKGSAGTLYAVMVTCDGGAPGNIVLVRDSTDGSGTALCTVTLTTTRDTIAFAPPVGITFSTGIYSDVVSTAPTAVTATYVYE